MRRLRDARTSAHVAALKLLTFVQVSQQVDAALLEHIRQRIHTWTYPLEGDSP